MIPYKRLHNIEQSSGRPHAMRAVAAEIEQLGASEHVLLRGVSTAAFFVRNHFSQVQRQLKSRRSLHHKRIVAPDS